MSMFKNRLEKNYKRLRPWANRLGIEAYRLFDRDIPEIQFIVDLYKDEVVVYDKTDAILDKDKNLTPEILIGIQEVLGINEAQIIIKKRERQEGLQQYEKIADQKNFRIIEERPAKLRVNLTDYLDTGLFLDHRPMRNWVFKNSENKRFLNLFCYTGSVSVFSALGGASHTTSVDMSSTYLNWAEENFAINGLLNKNEDKNKHRFVRENALEFLKTADRDSKFDLIFLDPPTFSNSKRMDASFEVERDQNFLVDNCMSLLNPNGLLIFSNNKRKFRLSPELSTKYSVAEVTERSIPQDFHDKKIHHCFFIAHQDVKRFLK